MAYVIGFAVGGVAFGLGWGVALLAERLGWHPSELDDGVGECDTCHSV
jgi:hypothetical protein